MFEFEFSVWMISDSNLDNNFEFQNFDNDFRIFEFWKISTFSNFHNDFEPSISESFFEFSNFHNVFEFLIFNNDLRIFEFL